jgi:GWxTD domain-containing protein
MFRWLPLLVLVALATPSPSRATDDAHAARARALFASAQHRLTVGTPAQRQFARTELEDAARLDPANHDIALALGNLYLEGDMLQRARDVAETLAEADPSNAAVRLLQGMVWRRYWLAEADDLTRDKAVACLARGARLAPGEYECWAALVPLLVDADELEQANAAAAFALRATPGRPEAMVLVASMAQRTGDLATADRLFRAAIPRLPAGLRARYTDLSPLLPPWLVERYTDMAGPARTRYEEQFWRTSDPDPVTEENEARLEYLARVTQAATLYGASKRPEEWDMRAQYYVRFGKPAAVELNPVGIDMPPRRGDWLAWYYPDLGMRVWMGGASAFLGFSERISAWAVWAQPYADSLAKRRELDSVQHGWAVFHRLPPGVEPLEAGLAVAHFETEGGPMLLAQVEAAGGPGVRVSAEWTVLDSTFAPVLRDEASMAPSACRPEEARAASLTRGLAPGRYRIGVHATDENGRLGVVRRDVFVPGNAGTLALSDLVVTCSPPQMSVVPGSSVRLEPETGLFPANDSRLNAYFEIYRLTPDANGDARFEYDCVVRSAVRDRRGWISRLLTPRAEPSPIEMSRRETTRGAVRRQFLSVPVGSLPAGTYVIEILVRDVATGDESKIAAQFERRD